MRIAYFDAGAGISGDMTVAALLDAGGARLGIERLRTALSLLHLEGYAIAHEQVRVGVLRASSFRVHVEGDRPLDAQQALHRHDEADTARAHRDALTPEPAGHSHHHHHHAHAHPTAAHSHAGPQPYRDWKTIRTMIAHAGERGLGDGIVARSLAIFGALAGAEARVHGVAPDDVHFHEVGAVDSIVDIVSAAWCLDELAIDACFVGPLPGGSGYVATEHGRLPVPAPATLELLRGFELAAGDGDGELVTPTGAAILSASAQPMRPVFRLTAVGIGAGTRRLPDRPNVLRVLLGECEARSDDNVAVLEADVDDMTPVALAHLAERLRAAGARDVTIVPTLGKKGRAGTRLTVVCDLADLRSLADRVLAESSSIGVRYRMVGRIVLPRRIEVVATPFGPIAVKVVVRPGGEETAEPEPDDVMRASITHSKPFAELRAAALDAWRRTRAGAA